MTPSMQSSRRPCALLTAIVCDDPPSIFGALAAYPASPSPIHHLRTHRSERHLNPFRKSQRASSVRIYDTAAQFIACFHSGLRTLGRSVSTPITGATRQRWRARRHAEPLHRCAAEFPIISTHLGVRVLLLLAPGLLTDSADNENYVPKGVLSGKMRVALVSETGDEEVEWFLLFDSRLYTGDLANMHATNPVRMSGIVNFGVDNSGHILLPEQCMALKLNWDGVDEGNLIPSGNMMIRSGTPAGFSLNSNKGLKIPQSELEEHV